MSIIHANTHVCNLECACEGIALRESPSLTASARRKAGDLMSRLRDRLELNRMKRFSDHRLRDIGFEHDWDGSLIRRQA